MAAIASSLFRLAAAKMRLRDCETSTSKKPLGGSPLPAFQNGVEERFHPAALVRLSALENLPGCEQNLLAFGPGGTQEVNRSVGAPDAGDDQGQHRLLEGAQAESRTDHVEGHADQVRKQTEARNEIVPDEAEVRAIVVGHHAQEATERVEDEGSEVGGERDRKQRVGQPGQRVVRG